ncbi:MAG: penicillin-binding protein 2 [Microthrixaceae bacterium]
MDTDSTQVRLSALGIVALSLFLALFVRLWFLQGIDRQRFEVESASNRLRVINEEGPRGRILDRNGKVLVDNRTSIVVALDREPIRKLTDERREAEFADLADTLTSLGVPTKLGTVQKRYEDKRYAPQEYVPIAEDVPENVELFLAERAERFPGVVVERRTIRSYPYGQLAAQIVGYVGEINEEELVARGGTPPSVPGTTTSTVPPSTVTTVPGLPPKPYQPGDTIGKGGVERAYESYLRAVPGKRTIEVNARGDLIDVVKNTDPVSGDDVWLSIDIDLQAHAERLLEAKVRSVRGGLTKEGYRKNAPQGSVVVLEPTTGQVLAMASYPGYDPSILVNGISSDLWTQLNDPASGRPLFNWALQGAYAPGSTFKPVTALAGWRTGAIGPGNEVVADGGVFKLQGCKGKACEFQNAGRTAHGSVDLARSLTVSSDVYYYRLGEMFWINRSNWGETPIQDAARDMGLGSRTGIALPGETPGRIPTPANRKEAYAKNPGAFVTGDWFTGDNVITAIGQGDVLVTPLQLAELYATIANDGVRYRPQVVAKVTRVVDPTKPPGEPGNFEVVKQVEPDELGRVDLPQDFYDRVVKGLVGVTQQGDGTASKSWRASPTAWPVAGKTGTSQVVGKADSALFAGWGPAQPGAVPQYAISVVIPEAGFGGDVAAPLAFRVLAPASKGQLPAACPVASRALCDQAVAAADAASSRDVGSGGPG